MKRGRLGLLVAIAITGLLCACSSGSDVPAQSGSVPSMPALRVAQWGVNDGMLSVVVVNDSAHTISSARASIIARDKSGAIVATVSGPSSSTCCTIYNLPPSQEYGLYVELGPSASRVTKVDAALADFAYAPASSASPATVSAASPTLAVSDSGAAVTADLTLHGIAGPYVAAQAILQGPDGGLAAVVSGRFYCFTSGDTRQVVMQLFHPVPDGTTVQYLLAYPIPAAAVASAQLPACQSPTVSSSVVPSSGPAASQPEGTPEPTSGEQATEHSPSKHASSKSSSSKSSGS